MLLPSWEPGTSPERVWAPVLAWALLRSLPGEARPEKLFDQLEVRDTLGAIFSTSGLEGEDVWRAAARARVLLAYGDEPLESVAYSRAFWNEPDVRWLTGVNESGGKTYFNQEATDELLAWMALPLLLRVAESAAPEEELQRLEDRLAVLTANGKAAGFELEKLLRARLGEPLKAKDERPGGAVVADDLAAESATSTKPASPAKNGSKNRK
jgi:hypothetical protein